MAFRLNLNSEGSWLELGYGVAVKVLPLSIDLLTKVRGSDAVAEAAANPENVSASVGIQIGREVARAAIIDWTGVENEDGTPAVVNDENVDALMRVPVFFEAFEADYLSPGMMLEQEKNGSAARPSGISAAAKGTVPRAKGRVKNAPTKSTSRKRSKAKPSGG